MSIFSGMGSFAGRYDAELQAKIDAALAGKASAKDKIDDFVKDELKIDPATLPLTPKQANTKINDLLKTRSKAAVLFTGTSLGIKHLTFFEDLVSDPPCDQCGNTDTALEDASTYTYYCYDCTDVNGDYYKFTVVPSDEGGEVVDAQTKDPEWTELMRCYQAITKDQDGLYTFRQSVTHWGDPSGPEFVVRDVEPDPKWYGTGYTLRLEKAIIGEENQYIYAKVGSLFNDKEVVMLPSMEPITDLESWRVVEIL